MIPLTSRDSRLSQLPGTARDKWNHVRVRRGGGSHTPFLDHQHPTSEDLFLIWGLEKKWFRGHAKLKNWSWKSALCQDRFSQRGSRGAVKKGCMLVPQPEMAVSGFSFWRCAALQCAPRAAGCGLSGSTAPDFLNSNLTPAMNTWNRWCS